MRWTSNTNYIITLAGLGNTLQPTVFVDNKTVTSNVAAKPLTLSFTTVPLPPSVQTTQPVKNDTNFSVIQNIGIRFSETMDTASVRAAFQISPATAGTFVWMSTSPPLNTLLWKSVTGSLQYETNYTVTIGNGAKSAANLFIDGNQDSLGGDQFVLKFRTQKQPSAVNDEKATPHIFSLGQNFPNPFNPITNIVFSIAEYGSASILIYDVLGRQIETVLNDKVTPGNYSVQWDASKYSSGIYFYKLSTEKFTSVKRMMLVK